MSELDILIYLIGGSTLVFQVFWHVELWQRKEYRIDRVLSVLRSPERRTLLTPVGLISALLVTIAWAGFLINHTLLVFASSWLYVLLVWGANILEIVRRGVVRPVLTLRAIQSLSAAACVVLVYLYFVFPLPAPAVLHWATLLLFIPYLLALTVIVSIPAYLLRKIVIIGRAQKCRAAFPDLTVVGITGSFGKTSTKFFVQHLLGNDRSVAVTAAHRNAPYVVALDMLKALRADLRYYIIEMGAYRQGEIKTLAHLTRPKIGVITAIGNQHLALFGSKEKILTAKWELIESLPADGIAILNADDKKLREKAHHTHTRIVWFSTRKPSSQSKEVPRVWVEIITITPDYLATEFHVGSHTARVTLPLVSEALLPSAAAAVAVADTLGVVPAEIFARLATLPSYMQTMQLVEGRRGGPIIDDSYSANEIGVLTALAHVQRFVDKKPIVVLRPLEELGKAGTAVHERIGAALAPLNQPVFLVNRNYFDALQRGLKHTQPTRTTLHVYETARELRDKVVAAAGEDTVVLLEGRMPDVVRKSLLTHV